MTVKPPRIAGWLLVPLAWLLMSLISSTLAVAIYGMMLMAPDTHQVMASKGPHMVFTWYFSVVCAFMMWSYTLWLTCAFFKRRHNVVRHYILWLMFSLILAVKAFALSPINDNVALRQLMFPLLAAALAVPYLKRSKRVKETFINP